MSKLTGDGRPRHPRPRKTDDIQDRDLHQPQGRRSFPNVFRNKSRKQVYEHYWDHKAVKDGLSSGQLVLGSLRINQRNYADAFISHPKGDADVFIPGTIARNRSLTGDTVVVCLEPLKKWRVYDSFLSEKVLKWTSTNHTNPKVGKAPFVTVEEFLRHDPEAFDELFENTHRDLKNHLEGFSDPIDLSDEPGARVKSTELLPWWQLIQRVGRVVAISRRLNCRVCVGFLRPTVSSQKQKEKDVKSPSTSEWQLALFSPMDSRMPRIVIPRSSCPPDFVRQPEIFNAVRFVARIIEWPEDSFFPKGELVRQFDHEQTSFIDAETDRILANVGFPFGVEEVTRFPKAVESYVSDELMGRFSPAVLAVEYARRRDFRAHCVFTIDPRTARDLDDALHVRRLTSSEVDLLKKKGVHGAAFEVGVHIADVSFYVLPEDPLDVEAASRATSIYLVQLCVPMLPRLLCEDLCSLHPGTDKLTFSVVFVLTEDAQILSNWFGRTTIHSRAKLSYEDAQAFLTDPNRDWQSSDFANLESGTDVKEICRSVLILNELAVKMRGRRLQNGALQLNQVKPIFTLAETTSLPVAMAPFIVLEANRLVEEWMLAANEAVANLLASRLPHTAFLRRHPPPTSKQIMDACFLLRYSGVDVNVNSAGAIQSSLDQLSGIDESAVWQHSEDSALCASMLNLTVDPSDPTELAADNAGKPEKERRRLLKEARLLATLNVLTKCMNLAEYFCLGAALSSSFDPDTVYTRHYALNMDHYTHFTSPIRRYADIVVHRQVAYILAVASEKANSPEVARAYHATCTSKVLQRPDQLAAIADFCNARKLDSRRASEESVEVFFTVFVKECGPLTEVCSVLNVLNQSFDVLILCTGVVRRVYLNRLDLCSYKYEAAKTACKGSLGTGTLHLRWNIRPPADRKALEEVRLPASLISDPAVVSAVPAPAGDDCRPSSPPAPAPCGCFYQELRLFDVCRCLLTVDEASHLPSSPEDSNNNSANRPLKMTVTLIRPTCDVCKAYA